VKKEGEVFTLLVASVQKAAPKTHELKDLSGFEGSSLKLKVEYGDFSEQLQKVVGELQKVKFHRVFDTVLS
jgi:predicted ester cyclase